MSTESTQDSDNTGKKQKGFRPGQSGNPRGKPKGKHKSTLIRERLSKADLDAIVKTLADAAKLGDVPSASLLLARAWVPPKPAGRFLTGFQLPVLRTAEDVAAALAVVISCVSNSLLTLSEASDLSALIERHGKALAASDHENRLLALEAANAPKMIGRS
jgi:Family of unknown function (DUF5681)